MEGFEKSIMRKLDHRNPGEHPVIMQMHDKAEETLKNDALNPLDFEDLYGKENVAHDLRKVSELKGKFESDETKRAAEVFEAIVYEHTELSNWLGQNAETIKTSEFDDIINGIDLIVEFSEEDSTKHLALGVDITFGSQTMHKKFDRIKKEIHNDELAKAKYFEAHGFKGSLKQLPRVVIGVEKDTVIALAGLWMRGKKEELGNHFVRDIIINEIEKQLHTFLLYAQSINSADAVKSYTYALNIIRKTKLGLHLDHSDKLRNESIQGDRVYQEIQRQLEDFRVTSR